MGCWSKAKSKSNPVDAACLVKAEAGFTAAFAKAGGTCGGDAGSIEMQVDQCVTALLAEIPGDSKCTSSSAKVLGKANLHSSAGYSIYEGWSLTGQVVHTVVRGRTVLRDRVLDEAAIGHGRYRRRQLT